jgi:hypothetical protein
MAVQRQVRLGCARFMLGRQPVRINLAHPRLHLALDQPGIRPSSRGSLPTACRLGPSFPSNRGCMLTANPAGTNNAKQTGCRLTWSRCHAVHALQAADTAAGTAQAAGQKAGKTYEAGKERLGAAAQTGKEAAAQARPPPPLVLPFTLLLASWGGPGSS